MDIGGISHGPSMWVHRSALRRFAPIGFLNHMDNRAENHHDLHDQFYKGSITNRHRTTGRYITSDLPPLIQHQFEPILRNDLNPMTQVEQDLRMHLKKTTGT